MSTLVLGALFWTVAPHVAAQQAPGPEADVGAVEGAWKDWQAAQAAAAATLTQAEWESDAEFADRRVKAGLTATGTQREAWEAAVTQVRTQVFAVSADRTKTVTFYDKKTGQWTFAVASLEPPLLYSGKWGYTAKSSAESSKLSKAFSAGTLAARLSFRVFPGAAGSGVYRVLLTELEPGTAGPQGFLALAHVPAWWLGEVHAGSHVPPTAVPVVDAVRVAGGALYFAPLDGMNRSPVPGPPGFFMGKTPVTQEQYWQVMGTNPSAHRDGFDAPRRPVDSVSLLDAAAFCNRLSVLDGLKPFYIIKGEDTKGDPKADGWRLPTQKQFWYVAEGGAKNVGHLLVGGDTPEYLGSNYDARISPVPDPVASSPPNELGLYDLVGLEAEWFDFSEGVWAFKSRGWEFPDTDGGMTPNFPSAGISFRVARP